MLRDLFKRREPEAARVSVEPFGWEFDVALARDETTLFWDNGAQVISGPGASGGTSFRAPSSVLSRLSVPWWSHGSQLTVTNGLALRSLEP